MLTRQRMIVRNEPVVAINNHLPRVSSTCSVIPGALFDHSNASNLGFRQLGMQCTAIVPKHYYHK